MPPKPATVDHRKAWRQRLAARSAGVLPTLIWPVREPLRIRLYVAGVAAAAAASTGTAAASTTVHARHLGLFAVLMISGLGRPPLSAAD
jgi:hypothetical protein